MADDQNEDEKPRAESGKPWPEFLARRHQPEQAVKQERETSEPLPPPITKSLNFGHFLTVPAATIIALGTIVATQGMKGNESKLALVIGYVGGWFLLFGVAAALPKMFTKAARQSALRAFVAFGAGGAATSILIGILIFSPRLGITEFVFPLLFLLPWLLGAAFWRLHQPHQPDQPLPE